MSLVMDIPKIAITQEGEDDDREYLTLTEALTDIEDLDEDSQASTNSVKRKSKLKIKLVQDDYGTDYEDVLASDNEDDEEVLIEHENPISIDDLDLDGGVYEESYKTNTDISPNKPKGKKKLKTQSSITESYDHRDAEFKVFDNYTDEEEFNTDNDVGANEGENEKENSDTYDAEESEVLDNIISKQFSTKMENLSVNDTRGGFLTTPSITPNLSDLTDIEIIHSDSDENLLQKKKIKRKRRSSRRDQPVTDVEDLDFSEPDIKQNPNLRKNSRRNRHSSNMKKSYSVPFDSDNEDENKLRFPVCKKTAGKHHNKILTVPEFDTNPETDIEEFENTLDDIYIKEKHTNIDLGSEENFNAVLSSYSQIKESHSVKSKVIQKSESDEIHDIHKAITAKKIKGSKQLKKRDDKPLQRNSLIVAVEDNGLTDCENLDTESDEDSLSKTSSSFNEISINMTEEEEFESDFDNEPNIPDVELPNPVRNLIILKENETLPTIQIIPLKDDSLEETEQLEKTVTDEESISETEDDYQCLVDSKDDTMIPVFDWGSTEISEHSQNKNSKRSENIRDVGTDTEEVFLDNPQKRKRAPKFKHLHQKFNKEKENTLQIKTVENLSNLTDTEDLNMSDEHTQSSQRLEITTDLDGGTDVEILDDAEDLLWTKIRPMSCTPQYLREMEGDMVSSKEGLGPFSTDDRINTLKPIKRQVNYAVTPTHSDSEEMVVSADEDFTTYSRAETVTPNRIQREIDQCISSEVREESKQKNPPEGVMYLKGGGYFCLATDVEEFSEEDIIIAREPVCDFMGQPRNLGEVFEKGKN